MKNTIKKRSIFTIITIMIFAIFLSNCGKDNGEKFTIRGKLLNSCDNPEPVSGHQLFLGFSYGINSKYEQIAATTSADGSFEFTYEKKNAMGEMTISGRQANGSGTLNYLFGIPIGRDLDIGNLYANTNSYAIIKITPKRQTSVEDTIFYHKVAGQPLYKSYITGPFLTGQILDTNSYRNTQFYDITNYQTYRENSPSGAVYPYKLTQAKQNEFYAKLTGKKFDEICFKYNVYEIVIE